MKLFYGGLTKNSVPYQDEVKRAARESGYDEAKVRIIMDEAAHVDPDYISERWGIKVGQACKNLQKYNSER